MKNLIKVTSFIFFILFAASLVNAQIAERNLPPDIDPESLSRLPFLLKDSFSEEDQLIFEAINGANTNTPRMGPPSNSIYSIKAAGPYDAMNQALRINGNLDRQVFEISTLVPAREYNSRYEWTVHERGARQAGVTDNVIDAIKYERPTDGLPERDATLIEYARALLLGDHQVPSALFSRMVNLFGREGTIEITMVIGDYTMTAMLLNAVDQHLPEGTESTLPVD
jgi:4-carboxymuconolactone decarboxylase